MDNFKEKSPLLNLPIQIRKKLFDRHAKNFSKFVDSLHGWNVLARFKSTDRLGVEP
ncbi:hypothetical protein C4K01_4960 [Pseudomonas synxantha]|nr:hypothetical protein C4K01_4960 [Pseudomonas synxantha]